MPKVYIASRYSRRNEMRHAAARLEGAGYTVTSRWLQETSCPNMQLSEMSAAEARITAIVDLEDIDLADTMVFFAEDPNVGTPRGGRHVEFGYALAKGKRLIVIGGEENIFHFLPQVVHYPSFQEFLDAETIENAPVAD